MNNISSPVSIDKSRAAAVTVISLLLANALIWGAALLAFRHFPPLLFTASLAYTFGLRHALDADHISAIDNVTRKLVQQGKRPFSVGLFFSLGHSTIVVILSLLLAVTGAQIQSRFPAMKSVGGLVGTSVSAFFLFAIAAVNLLILRGIVRTFIQIKRGEPFQEQDVDTTLSQLGILGRVFQPIIRLVDQSWKMYFVGFLFGLGFDTATEIGVLGISAATATQGLPVYSILLFPLLFTAGMCLLDTADGIVMLGAYGWAQVHPIRKVYYNMTITAISVVIAVFVGGLEILGIIGDRFELHGRFWQLINSIDFSRVGISIVALFLLAWAVAVWVYRLLGYHHLERTEHDSPAIDPHF